MTLTSPQRLAVFSNGNPKPEQLAEAQAAHDRVKDRAPDELSVADFASIGHEKRPLLAVIRQNCIECQGGYQSEVRRCQATACVFWPYRMGSTPFVSEARREIGRRLALSRLKSPHTADDSADDGPAGA